MKILLSLIAAMVFASAGAFAQPENTTDFLQKVVSGAQYEMAANKIAVHKAQSVVVKRFAQRMIRDHAWAAGVLKRSVSPHKLAELSADTTMTQDRSQNLAALHASSRGNFDHIYLEQMLDDRRQVAALFSGYAAHGGDARLRAFARRAARMAHRHLAAVERLQKTAATPNRGRFGGVIFAAAAN